MNNRPLIFVTNDDSIHAKGLEAAIDIVKPFGDVFVVAPMYPQSCKSHAITLNEPLRVRKIKESDGFTMYACSGTPVDCVKLGLGKLMSRKPDLIVSGVNHGSNASINLVYSGTLAAAAEGVFYKIPSIGFSLCNHSANADFSGTIPFGQQIVKQVIEKGVPGNVCLNVNFPDLPADKIKGIRLCRQHQAVWGEAVEHRTDPHGQEYYWLDGYFVDEEPDTKDETDENALKDGYVSVVPLQFDFTAHTVLEKMKDQWSNFK